MTATELLCQPSRATDDLLIAAALMAETTQSVESTYATRQYTWAHVNTDKNAYLSRCSKRRVRGVYVTLYVYGALASIHISWRVKKFLRIHDVFVLPLHKVHYRVCLISNFSIHNICSAFFLVQGQTQTPSWRVQFITRVIENIAHYKRLPLCSNLLKIRRMSLYPPCSFITLPALTIMVKTKDTHLLMSEMTIADCTKIGGRWNWFRSTNYVSKTSFGALWAIKNCSPARGVGGIGGVMRFKAKIIGTY